jgi:hypothetical protein
MLYLVSPYILFVCAQLTYVLFVINSKMPKRNKVNKNLKYTKTHDCRDYLNGVCKYRTKDCYGVHNFELKKKLDAERKIFGRKGNLQLYLLHH